ncbi:MAG: cryptochrome/photolyase family protein [Candidatus Kryptoniota bacterium]
MSLPHTKKRPVICWFRRDLRVHDNPALYYASSSGSPVISLFVVDTALIGGIESDGAVFDFQAECIRDLSQSIEKLGGRLIVRKGGIHEILSRLVKDTNPKAVYFNRDYEPNALHRDRQITNFLERLGIAVKAFDDVVVHSPDDLRTTDGRPYTVFSPYAMKWRKLDKPKPVGEPSRFVTPQLPSDPIPGADALGRKTLIANPALRGGETAALKRWNSFLRDGVNRYDNLRDIPSANGTSMMSPYLRFGCISPVRMYADLRVAWVDADENGKRSIAKYVDELVWREFYMSVLYYFPFTAERNYRQMFDGFNWSFDSKKFAAWKEGQTGFPLVDAGMRQLSATGWMHNRVRMVVASFLTKDLFIDWKKGEEYFSTKLLDIEKASNVGGWQWAASTGVDPTPLRIFNPVLQSRRFDPDGTYIKKWVPELNKVPSKYIHEPSAMSAALQKELGVIIGKDYPTPIVNHSDAAASFKRAYMSLKQGSR